MTGGEILGAAGAKGVAAVVKSAIPGAADKEQFREITKDSKATEVAAHARADRIAIAQMALTKLYAPLAKWVGYKSEYFDGGQFAADMAEKLADVPPERLVSPKPVVAAQAIEGLGFSLDEPDLKEMYLNLLATASDEARAERAHPSFPQIIKQLSPVEAEMLLDVLDYPEGLPMVDVRLNRTAEPRGYQTLFRYVIALHDDETQMPEEVDNWGMYVDNWVRLGLVNTTFSSRRVGDDAYAWADDRPEVIRTKAKYKDSDDFGIECHPGLLVTTALGLQFAAAVGPN